MGWTLDDFLKYQKRIGAAKPASAQQAHPDQKVDVSVPTAATVAAPAEIVKEGTFTFSVPGIPVGKPRMSQRDRWMKRPAVLRYRDYCDRLRACAPAWLSSVDVYGLSIKSYMAVKNSWSGKKKAAQVGQYHRSKPDGDNILKSVGDALFKEDSGIAKHASEKYWCATESQQRTEITIAYYPRKSSSNTVQ